MTNTETAIVIDTPEGIDMFRVLTMRSALKLEVETGMKMCRIPVLPAVNERFGTNFKRKQAALDFLNELLAEFDAAGK